MLYQKMRPNTFREMVGQTYVVNNIRNQSKKDIWFNSYILSGQFGSGKTTMARIIAMAANCSHKDEDGNPCGVCETCSAVLSGNAVDFKEIDGASNTGVDNIRSLKEYVGYKPVLFKKKVIIIDEVHKLSNAAFNSLLKVLEEPPEYTIFILCTTDVDSIPQTVQSRCAMYRFGAISEEQIAKHLLHVATVNGMVLTDGAATILAKHSSGAMRNALKYLEQMASSGEEVTEELVSLILGITDNELLFNLLNVFLSQKYEELPAVLGRVSASGKDYVSLIKELERACADAIVAKCAEPSLSLISGTERYKEATAALAAEYSLERLCALSGLLAEAAQSVKKDATGENFFVQSLCVMERLRETCGEREALLAQMQCMKKEIQELKQKVESGVVRKVVVEKEVVAGSPKEVAAADVEEPEFVSESNTEAEGLKEDGFTPISAVEASFDVPFEGGRVEESAGQQAPVEEDPKETPAEPATEEEDEFDVNDWFNEILGFDVPETPKPAPKPEPKPTEKPAASSPIPRMQGPMEPIPRSQTATVARENDDSAGAEMAVSKSALRETESEKSAPSENFSVAKQAEWQLRELAKAEPELLPHIQCGCVYEYRTDHLIVKTPELYVASLLSMFIGRADIEHIEVECDPNVNP